MPIYETFSKRQKRLAQAGQTDVYQYDNLPTAFRNQVIHIWTSAIGPYDLGTSSTGYGSTQRYNRITNPEWQEIHDTLARELGLFNLGTPNKDAYAQCQEFLVNADSSGALDIIELTFHVIDTKLRVLRDYESKALCITQAPYAAINELNHRFREHSIGYQFAGGQLIRVDSQYIHAEAVKPAIALLQDQAFHGASEEFLEAHRHYRQGAHKDAIVWALKALESTMRVICDARQWVYPANPQAKDLIAVIMQEELIPTYLQSQFTSLRSVLESGLPTVRNRTSGHGQGATPVTLPDYLAAYALHLAASNIVFLVEAHKAKP